MKKMEFHFLTDFLAKRGVVNAETACNRRSKR